MPNSPIHFVSQEARTAFEEILFVQVEGFVHNEWEAKGVKAHLLDLLEKALQKRNGLYIMLVRYKPLNNSDQVFFNDLESVVEQWALKWARPQEGVPTSTPSTTVTTVTTTTTTTTTIG